MPADGDRITMIRHMVLLGEGKPTPRIMRRRVASHNVSANATRQTISGTCGFGAWSFQVTSMLFSMILMG
jgi:hypothetical protein